MTLMWKTKQNWPKLKTMITYMFGTDMSHVSSDYLENISISVLRIIPYN